MFWVKTLGGLSKKRRNGQPQPTCHGRAAACGFACCFTGADMRTPQCCEAEAVTGLVFFFFYCRIPIVRMCDQKLSSCVMRINCSHSHSFGGGRGWTESHFISPKFKYFATELPTEEQNKPLEHKFIPVWYKLPGICIFFYQSTAVSGGSLQPGSVSLTCRQRLASLSVPVGSEVVKPQRTSAQWTLFIKAPWWLPDVPLGVRQS